MGLAIGMLILRSLQAKLLMPRKLSTCPSCSTFNRTWVSQIWPKQGPKWPKCPQTMSISMSYAWETNIKATPMPFACCSLQNHPKSANSKVHSARRGSSCAPPLLQLPPLPTHQTLALPFVPKHSTKIAQLLSILDAWSILAAFRSTM